MVHRRAKPERRGDCADCRFFGKKTRIAKIDGAEVQLHACKKVHGLHVLPSGSCEHWCEKGAATDEEKRLKLLAAISFLVEDCAMTCHAIDVSAKLSQGLTAKVYHQYVKPAAKTNSNILALAKSKGWGKRDAKAARVGPAGVSRSDAPERVG